MQKPGKQPSSIEKRHSFFFMTPLAFKKYFMTTCYMYKYSKILFIIDNSGIGYIIDILKCHGNSSFEI